MRKNALLLQHPATRIGNSTGRTRIGLLQGPLDLRDALFIASTRGQKYVVAIFRDEGDGMIKVAKGRVVDPDGKEDCRESKSEPEP